MEKREALKIIQTNYEKIKEVLSCVHYGSYHKEYYNLILQEEKDHRKFCPEGVTCGLTQGEAVKLFYVQTIFDYLFSNRILTTKEFLHVRKSHFLALSLVENYTKELYQALKGVNWQEVSSIDYAELMK
jgi:hypothetical protein